MTSMTLAARSQRSPHPVTRRPPARVLTAAVVAAAVVGLALSLATVTGHFRRTPPGPGDPVSTSFGSAAVTRASLTFVPATQGPPTMAKMSGTEGGDQLQVWVHLVNDDAREGWAYSTRSFALVDSAGHRLRPQGSSLGTATLPHDGAVDGQVWFDVSRGRLGAKRWLELRDDGGAVRLALPALERDGRPGQTQKGGDGHTHDH